MKHDGQKGRIRVVGMVILLLLVAVSIGFAWTMSRMSASDSNALSYSLVDASAELLMEQEAAWEAGFWHDAYNMMLRKLGHFIEYLLIGIFASLFFLTCFERSLQRSLEKAPWRPFGIRRALFSILAVLLSGFLCFGASWLDEFYWQRVSQRHPRWFDVGVDLTGSLLGILACLMVFSIGRWAGSGSVGRKS